MESKIASVRRVPLNERQENTRSSMNASARTATETNTGADKYGSVLMSTN